MFAEDLSVFFNEADFAVAASWLPSDGNALRSASVLLDAPDEDLLGQMVTSTNFAITYPITSLVGMDENETITVDGTDYKVRQINRIEDGRLIRAALTRIE